jgi:HSP20 family molecular chaperone IbpA
VRRAGNLRWVLLPVFLALATAASHARGDGVGAWRSWETARVVQRHGYPVFLVGGKPFFVDGAAFFYERIPRAQWRKTLIAYRALGVNTIDLYLIWNWHEPSKGAFDFTGRTDPRRDLLGLLRITHELGFKLILRPGPVIRNEWRNAGYPAWLLERPEYDMPLHDVLTGRYPATATLQNTQADAAAAQWLANATHRRYAATWLRSILTAVAPYAHDVLAIALDDDQGAYLDNDTWPAPHWRAYINWLGSVVRSVAGRRVVLFINTWEMKVTAASPVWAWGNWYQSDAYSIGAHDLAELDFATGLLQTQEHFPVMQAEFQAGWLQGADEGAPRPADPANTALALNELLREGAHGIVDFPPQDTIYPDGWEVPWANWSYAWDAALTVSLGHAARYAPTAQFGNDIRRYGPLLAATHPAADAAIVWPPSLFAPGALNGHDFAAFADAMIAMQRQCNARGLTCPLVDLAYAGTGTLRRYRTIVMPIVLSGRLRSALEPASIRLLARLRRAKRLAADLPAALHSQLPEMPDSTLLLADDGSYAFVDAINPSTHPRQLGPAQVVLDRRTFRIGRFVLPARSARLLPLGVAVRASAVPLAPTHATPPPFSDARAMILQNDDLRVALAPNAGARIAELSAPGFTNAASSIGLLRDAVEPTPKPSSRDYIARYTHPMPSGTFNRSYRCSRSSDRSKERIVHCSYDAPDIAGGARFTRTLRLAPAGDSIVVRERFLARDPAAHLASISGFALAPGDTVIAPARAPYLGILHGRRLAVLGWRASQVARADLRRTRGAELVTLVCTGASLELTLGLRRVSSPAEALRLLQTKRRRTLERAGGSGGTADAAASKAAEATRVGSNPTFPTKAGKRSSCVFSTLLTTVLTLRRITIADRSMSYERRLSNRMTTLARNGPGADIAARPTTASTWSPLQRLFGFDPFGGVMTSWDYGFEVTRTETGYEVEVPVPGFNSSNVEVTFKDDILSVNGKNERRSFTRSFTVPEDVDPDKISASVTDGMLKISLERHPEAQPKRIVVK